MAANDAKKKLYRLEDVPKDKRRTTYLLLPEYSIPDLGKVYYDGSGADNEVAGGACSVFPVRDEPDKSALYWCYTETDDVTRVTEFSLRPAFDAGGCEIRFDRPLCRRICFMDTVRSLYDFKLMKSVRECPRIEFWTCPLLVSPKPDDAVLFGTVSPGAVKISSRSAVLSGRGEYRGPCSLLASETPGVGILAARLELELSSGRGINVTFAPLADKKGRTMFVQAPFEICFGELRESGFGGLEIADGDARFECGRKNNA